MSSRKYGVKNENRTGMEAVVCVLKGRKKNREEKFNVPVVRENVERKKRVVCGEVPVV